MRRFFSTMLIGLPLCLNMGADARISVNIEDIFKEDVENAYAMQKAKTTVHKVDTFLSTPNVFVRSIHNETPQSTGKAAKLHMPEPYYQFAVPTDGDCAFFSLGMTRAEGVQCVLDNLHKPIIRRAIALEMKNDYLAHNSEHDNVIQNIFDTIAAKNNTASLLKKDAIQKTITNIYSSTQTPDDYAMLYQTLLDYFMAPDVAETYVKNYYGDLSAKRWVAAEDPDDEPASMLSALALAADMHIVLYTWRQFDENARENIGKPTHLRKISTKHGLTGMKVYNPHGKKKRTMVNTYNTHYEPLITRSTFYRHPSLVDQLTAFSKVWGDYKRVSGGVQAKKDKLKDLYQATQGLYKDDMSAADH